MPDVIDRLVRAINDQDVEAVLRCYHHRATVVGPEMQVEGPDQIGSYHIHIWESFPGAYMAVWEKVSEGDQVAIEGCYSGIHRRPFLIAEGHVVEPTGRRVNIRFCWLFTLEDDLIASHRIYHDQMEIYSQLGVRLSTMTR
jgi:predicted ester cyclase